MGLGSRKGEEGRRRGRSVSDSIPTCTWLVGKRVAWRADGRGLVPPEAANFSLKNDCFRRVVLCCFAFLLCCCCCLAFNSQHLLE